MRRATQLFVLLAVALAPSRAARAYRTAADLPELAGTERVRWVNEGVSVSLYGLPPAGLQRIDVEAALRACADRWSAVACSALDISYSGATSVPPAAGDGQAAIVWLREGWSVMGFAADAAATTDVLYQRDADGAWRIVDADMYLNDVDFSWSTAGAGDGSRDVQAVTTHELGHVAGLLHPCERGGADGAPPCSADLAFADTTMYPDYLGVSQRALSTDDEAGTCFLYPSGGCAVTGCPSGMDCTADGCVPGCMGVMCGPDEWCGPTGCARRVCSTTRCDPGCTTGTCGPPRLVGDPCEASGQCSTGHCSDLGWCAFRCTQDAGCPAGFTCEVAGVWRECQSGAGVFGDACRFASECVSRLCLSGAETQPICTRGCDETDTCPADFACGLVEDRMVCRPAAGDGCAVAIGARSAPPWWLGFGCVALTWARRRKWRS